MRHRLELLDQRGRQLAEIDGGKRQRNLTRLGARQREHLVDQPREPIDVLDLAGERALQLASRRGSSAPARSRRAAPPSGVRSSWASAVLNCRISPTECSRRPSVSLNGVAYVLEFVAHAARRQRRSRVAHRCRGRHRPGVSSGARAKPDSHSADAATEQRPRAAATAGRDSD